MDALTRGTDAPKLSMRDCCKRFTGAPVLDHVSFDVASGEFLSVLGPSGCGKTTLLRILAGLESPDAGSVLKDGADITRLPPERRSMGLVFQDYALFENMTVRQNVRYALRFHPQLRAGGRAHGRSPAPSRAGRPAQCAPCPSLRRTAAARGAGADARAPAGDHPLRRADGRARRRVRSCCSCGGSFRARSSMSRTIRRRR